MSLTPEEMAPGEGFYRQCVQELQRPYPGYSRIHALATLSLVETLQEVAGQVTEVSHQITIASTGDPSRGRAGWLAREQAIEVRYESVVSAPMRAADLLAGFLGTSPAGLDAPRAGLARAKADCVGRWHKSLDEREVNDVEQEIGPLLALGYA